VGPATAFCGVRDLTERLAAPLSPEDQTVQSMPDVSPTKWHRAHTTWFFETFVLAPHAGGYHVFDERYGYLFNSYYEAVGPRHPRPRRGLLTRPSADEVAAYRRHVDEAMVPLLGGDGFEPVRGLVELGLHHEQQHQELLLTDIRHVLSENPLRPAYGQTPWRAAGAGRSGWSEHPGGRVAVGNDGRGFAFDNESPRHEVLLKPFAIATSLVTCADWRAFVEDDGYRRPDLWMSDGWGTVLEQGWDAPLYWEHIDDDWQHFTMLGMQELDPAAPVEHVSWYEADAYARWAGARLPAEEEWESVAPAPDADPAHTEGWYGAAWQWTGSAYRPYPGFRPAAGAVGEYNGKFMVNQLVLRGSAWATPPGHARRTYRNFFAPSARWCAGGVRLARDLD
jgi:ergothioneine biosynthesis protein EgtB